MNLEGELERREGDSVPVHLGDRSRSRAIAFNFQFSEAASLFTPEGFFFSCFGEWAGPNEAPQPGGKSISATSTLYLHKIIDKGKIKKSAIFPNGGRYIYRNFGMNTKRSAKKKKKNQDFVFISYLS